jgi:type VI secretion system secreted protein VgrG
VFVEGASTVRALESGRRFTLQGHVDANGAYVLTGVTHSARDTSSDGGGGFEYTNSFTCIPAGVPFRPPSMTPRPVVPGPVPAVVIGIPGERLFTDKYGRVKVQFFWDREGKKDETSSSWIRVAQPVGSTGHGFFWLPGLNSYSCSGPRSARTSASQRRASRTSTAFVSSV